MQCRTVLCDVGPLTRCLTRRLVAYLPSRRCEFRGDDLIVGSCAWGCRMTLPGPSPWRRFSVAGPNLEFAPGFGALERAAQGKPEQQYGDTIIAAAEPDWKEVEEQALALLDRTRDLRVLAHLAVAHLHFAGFADFTAMLAYPATAEGGLAGGPSAARP